MNTGLVRFIAGLSNRWRSRSSSSPARHLRLGQRGETLACRFLRRNGYKILYRNFRGRTGGEIDVVCRDRDRKSTRLNSSHTVISYAVFCLKKKNNDEK